MQRRTKLTDDLADRVVTLYRDGLTFDAICEREGVTAKSVYKLLRRRGEPPRNRKGALDAAEIARLHEEGLTAAEIARQLRRHPATVRAQLVKQGLQPRRHVFVREVEQEVRQQITRLHDEGQTVTSIKNAVGLSFATVKRVLKEEHRETRTQVSRREKNPFWKGGRITKNGYVYVRLDRDDPLYRFSNNDGYFPEHRLTMARYLGRPLAHFEQVHHIDGDRGNNEIENLQLRVGNHGSGVAYCCHACGSRNVGPAPLGEAA